MGRTLQKKKNRSGVAKATQKPKSKKRVLNNHIIAANWDKSQTLAQNYKRLGLTAKLNKNTGGVEKMVSDVVEYEEDDKDRSEQHDPLNITSVSKRRKEQINLGEATIERDPKTGKILRIIDQPMAKANPLNDPLAELDTDSEEEEEDEVLNLSNQHGALDKEHLHPGEAEATTEVVRLLEEQASRPAPKYKRRQPDGEVQFIQELVRKYGDDYGKMSRDIKINYMQRSEGDLKKRIKKWREAGGSVD